MTKPLSDKQLQQIREATYYPMDTQVIVESLLNEIERLKAEAKSQVIEELKQKWEKQHQEQGSEAQVLPPIVCLCGSTRFHKKFNHWYKKLTCEGKIVLSIEIVTTTREDDELKTMLDELHLRKIDLSTEVMILNVEGYIGESTRREIEYANKVGKPITYLEGEDNEART